MGIPGRDGEQGMQGDPGRAGAYGLSGTSGFKGEKGLAGLSGRIGPKGLPGKEIYIKQYVNFKENNPVTVHQILHYLYPHITLTMNIFICSNG